MSKAKSKALSNSYEEYLSKKRARLRERNKAWKASLSPERQEQMKQDAATRKHFRGEASHFGV